MEIVDDTKLLLNKIRINRLKASAEESQIKFNA